MTTQEQKLQRVEPFLLRSMGAFGYLKIPRAFTDKFKFDKKTVQDPEALLQETADEVRLTYVWRKKEKGLAAFDGSVSTVPAVPENNDTEK